MLQLSLGGSQFVAGPAGAQGFPSAALDVLFALNPDPKSYQTTTGAATFTANSPSPTFTALGGISATLGPVKAAHTLFLRTQTPMNFRITQNDPSLTPTVKIIPGVNGLFVFEPGAGFEVTLVEVEGTGVIEYAAFGNT
jgi:hypothetical protein